MKVNIRLGKSHWLWVLCIMIVLNSCGGFNQYAQYTPGDDAGIRLKFEYPSNWVWVHKDETIMYTIDPSKPTPTPRFSRIQMGAGDVGIIKVIESRESNPSQAMDENIAFHVQVTNNLGGRIIRDETIDIDGIPARLFADRTPPIPEVPESFEVYQIAVYFCLEYRFYSLFLTVPYDEMDSDFVKSFEHMILTMEVIP